MGTMRFRWRAGLVSACALLATGSLGSAEIVTKPVEYEHEGVKLKGFLAFDGTASETDRRPGVLVVHEWWGLNDYARRRARMLAEMGFVAFAADMYGAGVVAEDRDHAAKLAGDFYGKPLMRTRARAALDVLASQPMVDRSRLAAIGYCFGGTAVLELAYSGAPVRGVVSFHGGLSAPQPADRENIRAKFLVFHGADDPFVAKEKVKALQQGLREAGTDWQMIFYGGVVHSFTNPDAGGGGVGAGAKYDAKADARSWTHMRAFLQEVFAEP